MLKDGDGALLAEDIIDGRIEEKCKGKYASVEISKSSAFLVCFLCMFGLLKQHVQVWNDTSCYHRIINNVAKMA